MNIYKYTLRKGRIEKQKFDNVNEIFKTLNSGQQIKIYYDKENQIITTSEELDSLSNIGIDDAVYLSKEDDDQVKNYFHILAFSSAYNLYNKYLEMKEIADNLV